MDNEFSQRWDGKFNSWFTDSLVLCWLKTKKEENLKKFLIKVGKFLVLFHIAYYEKFMRKWRLIEINEVSLKGTFNPFFFHLTLNPNDGGTRHNSIDFNFDENKLENFHANFKTRLLFFIHILFSVESTLILDTVVDEESSTKVSLKFFSILYASLLRIRSRTRGNPFTRLSALFT